MASISGTTFFTDAITAGSDVSNGHASGIEAAIIDKKIPNPPATLYIFLTVFVTDVVRVLVASCMIIGGKKLWAVKLQESPIGIRV